MILRKHYPKKLHVGSEVYKIVWKRKFPDGTVGECDSTKHEIRILMTLGRIEMLKTFLHELLHAIEFEYDLDLKHKMIYELEDPIFQLLVDNFWK